MRLFKCCFSAVILFTTYWQDSDAEGNLTNVATEALRVKNAKEREMDELPNTRFSDFVSIKKLVFRNSTDLEKGSERDKIFNSEAAGKFNGERKREIENGTFDPFKPLFLFPILPFLFPPKDENLVAPDRNEFPGGKNDTKAEIGQTRTKPFIFFDIAFNIRQIPLKNETDRTSDSEVINVKKLPVNNADLKKKARKRRNAKRTALEFFDDTPLFPDSELDEFLPKPDLFFPDLSFHPKPVKKLSRRKRDEKKPDVKNDLKFFFDAFDEAFTQTRKELERTDPILNFIKGVESSFGEKKDTDDFFSHLSDSQDNSNMKWKIQRNVKRLSDDHLDGLAKSPESPMIIVDKVVKIGEFHLHDDKNQGKKSKWKKKKKSADLKRKSLEGGVSNGEKNVFDIFKKEQSKGTKKRKRNNHVSSKGKGKIFTAVESKEIKLLPGANTSFVSLGSNVTIEKKSTKAVINGTEEKVKYENLLKVIDSIRNKFEADLIERGEKSKRKTSGEGERRPRKASYEDMKKNITEVLSNFLTLVTKEEGGGDLQEGERDQDDAGVFDWTEKEILDSLGARHKKEVEFPAEYVGSEKEKQVADLNFLFLTVTLPTILVFTSVLLVCFFSLRVKGKVCTKLFNPRQVYVVEDEMPSASKPLKTEAKARQNI